jgi:hypothetical protein
MSYRTNRKNGGVFKAGRPLPPPVGKVIASSPEIVSYIDGGSVYVEDGSGNRYIVKYADGHTVDVEFTDAFDAEASEIDEQEEEQAEDVEAREPEKIYNIRVVWDGAVDFSESYNAEDVSDRFGVMKDLIARYGKIAEDYLGLSAMELDDQIKQRAEEDKEESFL